MTIPCPPPRSQGRRTTPQDPDSRRSPRQPRPPAHARKHPGPCGLPYLGQETPERRQAFTAGSPPNLARVLPAGPQTTTLDDCVPESPWDLSPIRESDNRNIQPVTSSPRQPSVKAQAAFHTSAKRPPTVGRPSPQDRHAPLHAFSPRARRRQRSTIVFQNRPGTSRHQTGNCENRNIQPVASSPRQRGISGNRTFSSSPADHAACQRPRYLQTCMQLAVLFFLELHRAAKVETRPRTSSQL